MHRSDSTTIAKLAQTGRSSTLATPFSLKDSLNPKSDQPRRSHLSLHGHKHHHRHHHAHTRRSSKYDDKDIKSAVLPQPRTSFGDVVRPSANANSSTSGSASGSAHVDLIDPSAVLEYEAGLRRVGSRVVRPEDVARERARQKQREEQLRVALHALSEQSMTTTRRLDDTYYSILEKVSALHSTIDGLQELSTLTKKLGDEFVSDGDELVDEVNNSLDSIGDFETQARLLDEFEARITAGKEKAAQLNERLETARKRVQERERLEEEWRASVNRRLRIFWSVLGALAVFFLIVYIVYGMRTHKLPEHMSHANATRPHHSMDLDNIAVPSSVREILDSVHSSSTSVNTPPALTSNAAKENERLHVLDEL